MVNQVTIPAPEVVIPAPEVVIPAPEVVIPASAGIQCPSLTTLDSRMRGNDDFMCKAASPTCASAITVLAALFLLAACTGVGEVTVLIDSSWSPDGREVVMVPLDPAPLLPELVPRATAAQADSLQTLSALDDSAATLDLAFMRLRDDLNAEANALKQVDRLSNSYAKRYDEFRPRAARADSLRAARDRLNTRTASMRRALASLLPDSARIRQHAAEYRTKVLAARDGSRGTRVLPAPHATEPLLARLAPGDWWIGVAYENLLPPSFRKVSVVEGRRDTIHIGRTRHP